MTRMIKDCRKEGRLTIASNFTDLVVIYSCDLWTARGGIWPRDRIGGEPKSTEIKHDFHAAPLRQPRQLAEGVKFPEKNAGLTVLSLPFGGGGLPSILYFPLSSWNTPCYSLPRKSLGET